MSLLSERLNISSTGAKPKSVRFSLSYNFNLKNLFIDFVHQKDRLLYDELVCKIRDTGKDITDDELDQLLKEARGCISLLDSSLKLFVQVVLLIKWNHRSDETVKEFQAFLVELCSAQNYYTSFVIEHLVSSFKYCDEEQSWEDGRPEKKDGRSFDNIHLVIKTLLQLIPMSRQILLTTLDKFAPYLRRTNDEHTAFFYNALFIINYEPSLRPQILNIIVTKILSIDVHIGRSDMERILEEEDIFKMDTGDVGDSAPSTGDKSQIVNMVKAFDHSMLVMFSFLRSQCHTKDGVLQWDKAKSLYAHLLKIFESILLPTHASTHIQFIMFYMVALKDALCVNFLQVLWSKVINPSVAPIIRQASVSYIASLLSRGSFISIGIVEDCLTEMCTWAHNYIGSQDGVVIQDIRIHGVFYSTCQAIFYIIAFSHKQFVNQDNGLAFLSSLNLPKIVSCKLNPLRACHPGVVSKFASIARSYQLAYCYTVIERNSRACLPQLYLDSSGIESIVQIHLDTFFPFDPYTLPKSQKLIDKLYREYNEEIIEQTDDKKEEDNEDDFLESTVNKSLFSYSTSPGFIHYS